MQWDDAFGLGLIYMHARHYSPAVGRFLQPDPSAEEVNAYAYAANSPVTKVDPSGRLFWFVVGVVLISAVIDTAFYLAATPAQERSWQGWAFTVSIGALFTWFPVAKIGIWLARVVKTLIRRTPLPRIDPNKIHHIFGNPDHKLGPLVRALGLKGGGPARLPAATYRGPPGWDRHRPAMPPHPLRRCTWLPARLDSTTCLHAP